MPGANCYVCACSASRRNKEVGIFKLPEQRCKQEMEESDLLNVITKDRVVDDILKRKIDRNPLSVEHFLKINEKKKSEFANFLAKPKRHLWHFFGACFFKI